MPGGEPAPEPPTVPEGMPPVGAPDPDGAPEPDALPPSGAVPLPESPPPLPPPVNELEEA